MKEVKQGDARGCLGPCVPRPLYSQARATALPAPPILEDRTILRLCSNLQLVDHFHMGFQVLGIISNFQTRKRRLKEVKGFI